MKISNRWAKSALSGVAELDAERIEWTPQARADVRRIDRETALGLLERLADYVLTGYGDVERLTGAYPLELRLRLGDYRVPFYDFVGSSRFSGCYIGRMRTGDGATTTPAF